MDNSISFDNSEKYHAKEKWQAEVTENKSVDMEDQHKSFEEIEDEVNMEIEEQVDDGSQHNNSVILSNLEKCKNKSGKQLFDEDNSKFDNTSSNESNKKKSATKNTIKLHKEENMDPRKELSTSFLNSRFPKTDSMYNERNINSRKSYTKLRPMKSLSPRKNMEHNRFILSMDCGSNKTSTGFYTEFNNKRKQKIQSLRKSLTYLQRAGPGSYNLPNLFGGNISDSNLNNNNNNNPCYSIGKEDKRTIKVMDRHQRAANLGKFSPGVGRYSPDISKLKNKSPEAKIGREKRFIELKHCLELKKNVPHAYSNHETSELLQSTVGKGFTKEKRFLMQAKKEQETSLYPSPNHYNSNLYNTISSTQYGKLLSRTNSMDAKNSFADKSIEKFNKKQYYKELEKGYYHSISPGPGAYNIGGQLTKSLSYVRNSINTSFTKKKDTLPGPQSYITLKKTENISGGKIGTSRKGVDFTQVHSLYGGLISKGLV